MFQISYKKYLSIMQKYLNFTNKNLHVRINVTQKMSGVNGIQLFKKVIKQVWEERKLWHSHIY